jgi:ParB/RepB/Spo0J family partition protein
MLTTKPTSWFKKNPNQPRKEFSETELRSLGASMKAQGQLQPVGAMLDGLVLWGERRLQAAILVGLLELLVIITDRVLTDTEIRLISAAENFHRASLTGFEMWMLGYELMTINPGWNQKDLAEHLNLDPGQITRLLSPSKCIQAVQDALKDGTITISDCYAISKQPESEQAGLLAMKQSGASRDTLEQQGRKTRASGVPVVRASKIKVPLVSGSVVTVAGNDISLEEAIDAAGEAVKQMKAAVAKGLNAKTAMNVWKDVAAAG